jgi:hypothetical protein
MPFLGVWLRLCCRASAARERRRKKKKEEVKVLCGIKCMSAVYADMRYNYLQ